MTIRDKDSDAAIASKIINQTNCHLFLTGKAGTGKTTFLKYISEHTHKNSIVADRRFITTVACSKRRGMELS